MTYVESMTEEHEPRTLAQLVSAPAQGEDAGHWALVLRTELVKAMKQIDELDDQVENISRELMANSMRHRPD